MMEAILTGVQIGEVKKTMQDELMKITPVSIKIETFGVHVARSSYQLKSAIFDVPQEHY